MTEQDRPPHAVPGDHAQPSNAPLDEEAVSTDLDTGDGESGRVAQEPVGADNVQGGGEFPSPRTPPSGPSPGAAGIEPERDPDASPGEGFKEVLDADPERGGSATSPDER